MARLMLSMKKAVEFINEVLNLSLMYLAYNAVHAHFKQPMKIWLSFEGHPRQKLAAMTYTHSTGALGL